MTDLSPEYWERIDTLFAQAIERPADERTAFLRHACGHDPTLYHAVEALIALEAEAAQVLGESATEFAAPLMPAVEAELAADLEDDLPPGRRVGPYRIVRVLGRGGMGCVYLAERADSQYHQQVALKLVKRGMDTDEILRRFRYERQILASLEHPHIGRLYDGGVTDDGRPYLVMEYVDGEPITAYCDARRLDLDTRLALFHTVCKAVQYAHQKLVVHRDLKPSNILVTAEGQVKLLDFGIAKLLTSEPDPAAPQTRPGVRVLTPEYASPEQLRGESATTAADVFALGVLLHELLVGHRPSTQTADSADGEGRLPPLPSTVVGHDAESATARGTTPEQLRRSLRGDLDTILLKALHPTAERRYASVEALHDDLHRHLIGLPVHARPDALGYRTRKFVGRHRAGLSAAVAIAMMLVAFAAFYTVRVAEERDVARQERDKAEEVAAFLEGLFDASDPFLPERIDTLRAPDLLAHGVAKVQQELADRPLVQAHMLNTIGRAYDRMSQPDAAEPLLRQALATRRTLLGDEHLDVTESLDALGWTLYNQGRYDEAASLLREALAIRQDHAPEDAVTVAASMRTLGTVLLATGQFDEAAPLLRRALNTYRRSVPRDDVEVATSLSTLALALWDEGDHDGAEALFRESVALRRTTYGPGHPSVAVGLNNLAGLLRDEQRYDEAEPLLREALAINRAALGMEHRHVVDNLSLLASVLRGRGDLDAAEPIFREVLALRRKRLGPDHPNISITLDSYAALLKARGDYEGAERAEREAIAIARRAYGDEHFAVALTTSKLAGIIQRQGRLDDAEVLYQQALASMERLLPPDNLHLALTRIALASCLHDLRRYELAEPLLLTAYGTLENTQGPDSPYTQRARQRLAALYEAWGRPEEAASLRSPSSVP